MHGIVEPDCLALINGTRIYLTCAILRHTLQVWQTGEYKELAEFKADVVEGKAELKPTSYSPGH